MRTEHDFLGERQLPDNVYYGVQTLRGKENFHITGIPISHAASFIVAFAHVKKAAALANKDLGVLEPDVADAICRACDAIAAGELHDQFVVDVIQGGAGTSTNMNANEVIANKALELMGHPKGSYDVVHPNNHVNCSQSTNDAYPTAFRLSLYEEIGKLITSLGLLQESFARKGKEFADVIKMGRTQLQDAVPMTLGQEFDSFAVNIGEDLRRLEEARMLVTEVNLGATAIGTSINAPEGYPELSVKYLKSVSGVPVTLSQNLIEATWDNGAYVQVSGVLKRVAVKLSKICNDLRLLSSGPRCGFNEINLPRMQPGSSIMPGKINPVLAEMMNMACFHVQGCDHTVALASQAGQLELNVMMPIIAHNLNEMMHVMIGAIDAFTTKCVVGIEANREKASGWLAKNAILVTALNREIGYLNGAAVAKESMATGKTIKEVVVEKGLLSAERVDELLDVIAMTKGGIMGFGGGGG